MDTVVAAVIRRNEDSRLLIIRRGRKLAGFPGLLCLVGGRVDATDVRDPGVGSMAYREELTLGYALVREVRQEIGGKVVVELKDIQKAYRYEDPKKRFVVHMVECHLDMNEDESLELSLREVDELRWMTVQELLAEKDLIPSLQEWVKHQMTADAS